MLANKSLTVLVDPSQYRKELESLYARISNIDALIESLEQYDRFHSEEPHRGERRTA
jgi:hypothetical protein